MLGFCAIPRPDRDWSGWSSARETAFDHWSCPRATASDSVSRGKFAGAIDSTILRAIMRPMFLVHHQYAYQPALRAGRLVAVVIVS